jgi:CHAT domain
MPKREGLEWLFTDAVERYRNGDVVGATDEFLNVAGKSSDFAQEVLPYLFAIANRLDQILETEFTSFGRDYITIFRHELDRWSSKHPTVRPTAARARIIRYAIANICEVLQKTGHLPDVTSSGSSLPESEVILIDAGKARESTIRYISEIAKGTIPPARELPRTPDFGGAVISGGRHPTIANGFTDADRRQEADEVASPRVLRELYAIKPTTVQRTPHIELIPEAPVQPGSKFQVRVFADKKSARADETSDDIVVPSGATLEVQLVVSEHFSLSDPTPRKLKISADKEVAEADRTFEVAVKPANLFPREGIPTIIAHFSHETRPCGKVERAIEIAGFKPTVPSPLGPLDSPSAIRVEIGAVHADLTVTVKGVPGTNRRKFLCKVRTPHLRAYKRGIERPWHFDDATDGIVRGYMKTFTSKMTSRELLPAALVGAGIQLFDKTPDNFKNAFWQMIDKSKRLDTILIVSEEPYIPWELMVPKRRKNGKVQQRNPLGVDFRIGRWTPINGISPGQRVPLLDSVVVAPDYDDKSKVLKFAAQEKKLVLGLYTGNAVKPVNGVQLQKNLQLPGRSLVHFVCHGKDDGGSAQIVFLSDDEELSSDTVGGMKGVPEMFEQKAPFVFLNACEVGRATPALVGLGGFSKAFIEIGASAVIAPLWSVKDEIAYLIAKEFYESLRDKPETPFAEIMRRIRTKAYQENGAEDTYAAYCFYGDPDARRLQK